MKSILVILLFLSNAFALDFNVEAFLIEKYQYVPGFDYQLILFTPVPDEKVILDCQSFINGLHVYQIVSGSEDRHIKGFPLSGGQCAWAASHIIQAGDHNEQLCLKYYPDSEELTISKDTQLCQEYY